MLFRGVGKLLVGGVEALPQIVVEGLEIVKLPVEFSKSQTRRHADTQARRHTDTLTRGTITRRHTNKNTPTH